MKKLILLAMAVSMLAFCGTFAQAQEPPKDSDGQQTEQEQVRSRKKVKSRKSAEHRRGGRKREMKLDKRLAAIEKQMGRRNKAHSDFIAQLKAIKNQAEKEGAEKTVGMLDKLIEQQKKKHAGGVKKLEKDKENAVKQLEKRKEQAEKKAKSDVKKEVEPPAKDEAKEEVKEEVKKKKKWWKFGRD